MAQPNQPNGMMSAVAENVTLKAMHQLLNVVVLPLIGVISIYGLTALQDIYKEISAIEVSIAELNAMEARLNAVEQNAHSATQNLIERPRFDARDAAALEAKIMNAIRDLRDEMREDRKHNHSVVPDY